MSMGCLCTPQTYKGDAVKLRRTRVQWVDMKPEVLIQRHARATIQKVLTDAKHDILTLLNRVAELEEELNNDRN